MRDQQILLLPTVTAPGALGKRPWPRCWIAVTAAAGAQRPPVLAPPPPQTAAAPPPRPPRRDARRPRRTAAPRPLAADTPPPAARRWWSLRPASSCGFEPRWPRPTGPALLCWHSYCWVRGIVVRRNVVGPWISRTWSGTALGLRSAPDRDGRLALSRCSLALAGWLLDPAQTCCT